MATSELDARRLAAMGDKLHSRNNISTRGIRLTDAEIEAIMDGFEKEDDSEKTWTRRLVENYLQNVRRKFEWCVLLCHFYLLSNSSFWSIFCCGNAVSLVLSPQRHSRMPIALQGVGVLRARTSKLLPLLRPSSNFF